jgi:hypothetical protein
MRRFLSHLCQQLFSLFPGIPEKVKISIDQLRHTAAIYWRQTGNAGTCCLLTLIYCQEVRYNTWPSSANSDLWTGASRYTRRQFARHDTTTQCITVHSLLTNCRGPQTEQDYKLSTVDVDLFCYQTSCPQSSDKIPYILTARNELDACK